MSLRGVITRCVYLWCVLLSIPAFEVPENCPRDSAMSQHLDNATKIVFTIGGLFPIHQQHINSFSGKTQCTATSSLLKPQFHRSAVEQAEALILATDMINSNPEILPNVTLQYAMWDTCGILHSQCAEDQARALVENNDVIGTIVGPYFYDGSERYDEKDIADLYEQVVSVHPASPSGRALISFIDVPFTYDEDINLYNDLKARVAYLQQSCILQARAAVDFLDHVGWQEVSVVASDDNCGTASLQEFASYIEKQGFGCRVDPTYYQENAAHRIRSKREAGNAFDNPIRGTEVDLWELHLAKPAAPRAVVLLTSIPHANSFLKAFFGAHISSRDTFLFLLGDFWGETEDIDELFSTITAVKQEARHVVTLRSKIKGVEKFQDHMSSLRWNSPNLQKNDFLRKYWEDKFNCSLQHNTCNETDHLNPIVRPILRNSIAPLVIDSVYMLASYLSSFMAKFPRTKNPFVNFQRVFWQGSPQTTNITSWTGNIISLTVPNTGKLEWIQPNQWIYEFLLLQVEGRNNTLETDTWYDLMGIWEFNNGSHMIKINDSVPVWKPSPITVCPIALPPTTLAPMTMQSTDAATLQQQVGQTPTSTGVESNPCSHTKLTFLISIPLIIAVFHILFSFIYVALKGWPSTRRSVLSPGTLLFISNSTVAVTIATLVVLNVIPALKCDDNLKLDFLINVFGCVCYAALFVELLSQKIGGILERFPSRLILYILILLVQCIVSGFGCFSFNIEHNLYQTTADHCLDARKHAMIVISYWYNVVVNVLSVVILFITYCSGKELRLQFKPQVVSLVAMICCAFYAVAVSVVLWTSKCLTHAAFLVIIAVYPAVITLAILGMATASRYIKKRDRKRGIPRDLSTIHRDLHRMTSHHYVGDPDTRPIDALGGYWDGDIIREIHEVLIEPRRLETEKRVGKGNFGEVFKGKLDRCIVVAIKSVKDRLNRSEVNSFIREGLQMKNFKHPNVMELMGICWSDDPTTIRHVCPLIVLPFMELGDLKNFLRQRRPGQLSLDPDLPANEPLTLVQLVKFGHQIARGMEYIGEKGIVHRDLAARNCMVNLDLEIKVADFGLARTMAEGKDYYRMGQRGQLPVRWMALESLIDMVFAKSTDIWSFGVTLWEVMTLAQLPYPGRQNHEVMPLLKKGERLEKPPECPQEIYDLMYKCWNVSPEARPSFYSLVKDLEEFLSELMNYFDPMVIDQSDMPSDPYLTWKLVQNVDETTEVEQEMEDDDSSGLVVDINWNIDGACAKVTKNVEEISSESSPTKEAVLNGRLNSKKSGMIIENPLFESQLETVIEVDPSE